ncbi:MAG TPA: hypothetical protein VEA58_11550, partial [Anaerovoracaceae bacterium]|nr:hypothetical protein [Anaerovoracaceae bacterium]
MLNLQEFLSQRLDHNQIVIRELEVQIKYYELAIESIRQDMSEVNQFMEALNQDNENTKKVLLFAKTLEHPQLHVPQNITINEPGKTPRVTVRFNNPKEVFHRETGDAITQEMVVKYLFLNNLQGTTREIAQYYFPGVEYKELKPVVGKITLIFERLKEQGYLKSEPIPHSKTMMFTLTDTGRKYLEEVYQTNRPAGEE